mgnify:CR=1 FL=1
MNKNNITKGGIALIVIGIILTLIGIGLFLSVFFSFFDVFQNFGSNDPFGHHGFHRTSGPQNIPFIRAVIGVILAGIGGVLTKVGLGMGIVGSSDSIARWFGNTVKEAKDASTDNDTIYDVKKCPSCNSKNDIDAKYCDNCGTKL